MIQTETSEKNKEVLDKASKWFLDKIIRNHISNTLKLSKASEFNLNPLLAPYLSAFITGEVTPYGIAKALVYGRIGTSLNTSFGTNLQNFVSEVLGDAYGSIVSGVDIHFKDQIDGEEKICQLKLGPNTINKDDVETINNHFKSVKNLARTNNFRLNSDSLVIGVIYGTEERLSQHYRNLRDKHHYPIFVGKNFWLRLTGDELFFQKLVHTIAETLAEVNASTLIEETIQRLANEKEIVLLAGLTADGSETESD